MSKNPSKNGKRQFFTAKGFPHYPPQRMWKTLPQKTQDNRLSRVLRLKFSSFSPIPTKFDVEKLSFPNLTRRCKNMGKRVFRFFLGST